MKTKSLIITLTLALFLCSHSAMAQNSPFDGEWKLNTEKTTSTNDQLFLSKVTIKLKSDSLLTTRVYENYNGEQYPFVENLSLNNKVCKIYIYDMPRATKASRSGSDGSVAIESTTTFYGNNGEENMTAKENWSVDKDGKMLTVKFTNTMSGTESTGTNFYNKVK